MNTMRLFLLTALLMFQCSSSQERSETYSPYKSNWTIDGLTLGAGLAVAFSAAAVDDQLTKPTTAEIGALNKNEVNFFDRIAAGNYSKLQMTASDIVLYSTFVSPLALLVDDNIRNDWGTITTMYCEMALFSNFVPSYGKGSVKRFRPYAYSSSA